MREKHLQKFTPPQVSHGVSFATRDPQQWTAVFNTSRKYQAKSHSGNEKSMKSRITCALTLHNPKLELLERNTLPLLALNSILYHKEFIKIEINIDKPLNVLYFYVIYISHLCSSGLGAQWSQSRSSPHLPLKGVECWTPLTEWFRMYQTFGQIWPRRSNKIQEDPIRSNKIQEDPIRSNKIQ